MIEIVIDSDKDLEKKTEKNSEKETTRATISTKIVHLDERNIKQVNLAPDPPKSSTLSI